MALIDIQNAFKDFIISNNNGLTSYIDYDCTKKFADRKIESRLNVYKTTTMLTLMHCVKDIYPQCGRVIGKEKFNGIVEDYISKFPSTCRDITFYGHRFCEHIKQYNENPKWAFIENLAQLEWAIYNAYYAKNTPVWPNAEFELASARSIDSIRLILNDSVYLLASEWPVLNYYQQLLKGDVSDGLNHAEKAASYIIVYRTNHRGEAKTLSECEWEILTSVQRGNTLTNIIQDHGDACEKYLPSFINSGWICNFEELIEYD